MLLVLILVGSVSAVNINSVNSVEIEPGKTGLINIDVENNHEFDVEDVSLILDLSSVPIAPYFSSAEAFIGQLDEGDEESINFNVVVSAGAELGLYKIPVMISYVDKDGVEFDKVDFISVLVVSDPKISVYLDEPNYIVGNRADISVQIVNRGLSDVKFLSIELKDSSFYDLLSLDEIYVGDLDSDDFDNAEYKLILNYPLPNKINLLFKIKYYDANNNFYSEDVTLVADVYSVEKAKQLGLISNVDYTWLPILIVILIVSFIVYRIIKKRRRKSRMKSEKVF